MSRLNFKPRRTLNMYSRLQLTILPFVRDFVFSTFVRDNFTICSGFEEEQNPEQMVKFVNNRKKFFFVQITVHFPLNTSKTKFQSLVTCSKKEVSFLLISFLFSTVM